MKKTLARLALRLGGFDKVRNLTLLQVRLLSEAITDEQLWQARINGCEIKQEEEKVEFTSFSDAFSNI